MLKKIILPFILTLIIMDLSAQNKFKILIAVDMEGIAGVVTGEQLGPSGFEYARFRQFTTNEALAAIAGAREAGATEIVVADSHGNGQNLLIEQFPDDIEIVRSWPRRFGMMGGIDDTFDAVMMIGYHSSTSNKEGVRAHTFSSARLTDVKLNGASMSEGTYAAYLVGEFGVPVILITGDDAATAEMKELIPNIETAVVKQAYGFHSAKTMTPGAAVKLIKEKAKSAVQNAQNIKPVKFEGEVTLDISFKNYRPVEVLKYLSIVDRIDSHTVRFVGKNMIEVDDFRTFLMEYSSSISP
jgi:D-amino peptidase